MEKLIELQKLARTIWNDYFALRREMVSLTVDIYTNEQLSLC